MNDSTVDILQKINELQALQKVTPPKNDKWIKADKELEVLFAEMAKRSKYGFVKTRRWDSQSKMTIGPFNEVSQARNAMLNMAVSDYIEGTYDTDEWVDCDVIDTDEFEYFVTQLISP